MSMIHWNVEEGMMRDTIGIKVAGKQGIIYFSDFIQACNNFLDLLNEIDVTLSEDYKPTIDWKIKTLSYSSPAQLITESIVKKDRPDNRERVIDTVIYGTNSLITSSRRPTGFSDRALEIARDLAKSGMNGIEQIDIITDESSLNYTSDVIDNIDLIMKPGKVIFGSVEGRLERMNSHGDFNFHIFEPILARRIRCELSNPKDLALKTQIISLYEQDVIVSGLLTTNINGEVSSVKVERIEHKRLAPLIKSASEVTGIWDFLGDVDPVEHIRRIRSA
jgi:hypothetical protein